MAKEQETKKADTPAVRKAKAKLDFDWEAAEQRVRDAAIGIAAVLRDEPIERKVGKYSYEIREYLLAWYNTGYEGCGYGATVFVRACAGGKPIDNGHAFECMVRAQATLKAMALEDDSSITLWPCTDADDKELTWRDMFNIRLGNRDGKVKAHTGILSFAGHTRSKGKGKASIPLQDILFGMVAVR